jgi:hypothetical protein
MNSAAWHATLPRPAGRADPVPPASRPCTTGAGTYRDPRAAEYEQLLGSCLDDARVSMLVVSAQLASLLTQADCQ